jgi:sulfotransferase
MAKTFHFISGLPRSGSTLLSALLRQNPRFHAGIISPLAPLTSSFVAQVSTGSEISTMISMEQRKRILEGLFANFYQDHSEEVIFDTNRSWTAQLPLLMQLFPDSKMICCVRNISWIMDSIEQRFRANGFENTRLFNSSSERATVYTRVETLAHPNRLVGMPYQALREACWSEHSANLMLIDYDVLVERPKDVMRMLYLFIGEEPFTHDFENVEYDAPEFDAQLGVSGMHKVHQKVGKRDRKTILPPDLFKKYANMSFWHDLEGSSALRLVSRNKTTSGNI